MTEIVCKTKSVPARAFRITKDNIRKPETWPTWVLVSMIINYNENDTLWLETDDDSGKPVVAGVSVDVGDYLVLEGDVSSEVQNLDDESFREIYQIATPRKRR